MHGRIIREQRGSGGFGYDVVFVADEHSDEGLTSAELDPAEKDRISHRGRALREIAPSWRRRAHRLILPARAAPGALGGLERSLATT